MLYPRLASLAVLLGAGLVSFLFYFIADGQTTSPGGAEPNMAIAVEYLASAVFAFIAYAGAVGVAISFAVLPGVTSGKFVWRDNYVGRMFSKLTSYLVVKNEPEDKDEEPGYCAVSLYIAALVGVGFFVLILLVAIAHAALTDLPRFIDVSMGLGTFLAGFAGVVALFAAFLWLSNKYPKTALAGLTVIAIFFVRHAINEPVVNEFRWGEFASMSAPLLVFIFGVVVILWMKSKLQKLRFYSNLCPLMEARKD